MKLSVELEKWRVDRHDEWKMDEFIRNAAKLEAERDALAAQVDGLTKTIIEAKAVYEEFSLFVWKSFVLEITNSARVCNRRQTYEMLDEKFQSIIPDDYVAATPQQHLAEIRAQAGRVGFVAGYHKMHIEFVGSLASSEGAEFAANQYADSIIKGGNK